MPVILAFRKQISEFRANHDYTKLSPSVLNCGSPRLGSDLSALASKLLPLRAHLALLVAFCCTSVFACMSVRHVPARPPQRSEEVSNPPELVSRIAVSHRACVGC